MFEKFLEVDKIIFKFFNQQFTNSFFDFLMPFITDINKSKIFIFLISLFVTFVFWKGDRRTRTIILFLIPTVIFSDQINNFIKQSFERLRPCNDISFKENVRLLVSCGSGYSFPSSHAVNNFAGAKFLSNFFPNKKFIFYTIAFVMAYSRVYVGVHFPSDVIVGSLSGIAIGILFSFLTKKIIFKEK